MSTVHPILYPQHPCSYQSYFHARLRPEYSNHICTRFASILERISYREHSCSCHFLLFCASDSRASIPKACLCPCSSVSDSQSIRPLHVYDVHPMVTFRVTCTPCPEHPCRHCGQFHAPMHHLPKISIPTGYKRSCSSSRTPHSQSIHVHTIPVSCMPTPRLHPCSRVSYSQSIDVQVRPATRTQPFQGAGQMCRMCLSHKPPMHTCRFPG